MLALITVSVPAFSQYHKADRLMSTYRESIEKAAEMLEEDPQILESVVYPEVIRYSALQDDIEKSLVNGMYVKFGIQKGDFSIGVFQMKPSFVEKLERKWNLTATLSDNYQLYFSTLNGTEISRRQRINKISSIEGQCIYIAVFVKLMCKYYPEILLHQKKDKVQIIAAAYNHGVDWPNRNPSSSDTFTNFGQIIDWMKSRTFHTDLIATPFTEYLNYSDLAGEHYDFLLKKFGGSNK